MLCRLTDSKDFASSLHFARCNENLDATNSRRVEPLHGCQIVVADHRRNSGCLQGSTRNVGRGYVRERSHGAKIYPRGSRQVVVNWPFDQLARAPWTGSQVIAVLTAHAVLDEIGTIVIHAVFHALSGLGFLRQRNNRSAS